MFRFIAVAFNGSDAGQSAFGLALRQSVRACFAAWKSGLECADLLVLYTGAVPGATEAHALSDGTGVVLGSLFERPGTPGEVCPACGPHIDPERSAKILASEGRALIDTYWGRYVAFLRDVGGSTKWVIRDPGGHLPCYVARVRGATVYFSSMEDCEKLHLHNYTINWDYMAARVLALALQSKETGLNEVTELQPGECHRLVGDVVKSSLYWNPFVVSTSHVIDDVNTAMKLIRDTTISCVHSWASCYNSILVRVSGGLDSSIVLGCLRDAPTRPAVTCLTYHSVIGDARADVDERSYARMVAAEAQCQLVELPRQPTNRLEIMTQMSHSPIPSIFFDRNVELDDMERKLARQTGATARFGGEGGDQVFYQSPVVPTVGDFLSRRGLRFGLISVALDVARQEGISLWRVLGTALHTSLLRPEWDPLETLEEPRPFVTADATYVNLADRFIHPCFQGQERFLRGKLWHAYMLSIPPGFYSKLAHPGDPEWVEPLFSQPLVEVCLRIPSYLLTIGGRDRGLARRAFTGLVPPDILHRRSKGGLEGFIKETVLKNINFAREMLLDGLLVKHGLLDKSKLESALMSQPAKIGLALASVFDYLEMEVWARCWIDNPQRAVA